MAKVCGICGKELGMMTAKVILKDAVLCTDCAKDLPRLSVSQDPFTLEEAKTIHAPVIQEAFMNIECSLK